MFRGWREANLTPTVNSENVKAVIRATKNKPGQKSKRGFSTVIKCHIIIIIII